MLLTSKFLLDNNFSPECPAFSKFCERWPNGAETTFENCLIAVQENIDAFHSPKWKKILHDQEIIFILNR